MRRLCADVAVIGALAALPLACTDETTRPGGAGPSQELIDSALSAAPPSVARDASVVIIAADGTVVELKKGTSPVRCLPDDPETPGADPMCLDEQGFRWLMSLMRREARPANTAPGFAYMLQGGPEARGPFEAATEDSVVSPPHVMVLWPFDPEATGLPTESSRTSVWIMWAGTPYAHLMIPVIEEPDETETEMENPPGQPMPE